MSKRYGISAAAVALRSRPDRHALVLLDCECRACPSTWAQRPGSVAGSPSRVTLVAPPEREGGCRLAWHGGVAPGEPEGADLGAGGADRGDGAG